MSDDFSDDQIRSILLEHRFFLTAREICDKWGISAYRLRKWKQRLPGWRRLSTLEDVVLAGLYPSGRWMAPGELVGWLDYQDHARYSEAQIRGFLEALEDRGLVERSGDRWRYDPARKAKEPHFVF